ncbi:hypothetical protein [Simkania negevensis]|uniref:Uncharacterized protein n=1 Tax=Simkania negevensis (strain ATCC VR-1471 / DSM 27360 / Z) TaxID=331113 RepID=F8L426_SIMNZ|nr:hypothetical protein [Simkania negevensis]CCB90056.1 putative uncharacterized protein [Simkania negevensis Z]
MGIFRLFCVSIFFLFGSPLWGGNKLIYSNHEIIANKLIAQVAKDLSKRYKIRAVGFGGAIHEQVEELSLSFECCRTMSIDEYRDLLVHCAEDFLDQVNSNEEIRPYLQNYPFSSKNIDLTIYVHSENKKRFDVGQLSCLAIQKEKIVYYYRDSEYTIELLKAEAYEEAKKIVFSEDKDNNEKISL